MPYEENTFYFKEEYKTDPVKRSTVNRNLTVISISIFYGPLF